ncbi:MAG: lysophospholipase [Planctomycetaceae bacterium]|nr:lysophospholipase [Planctomycetaceae bacterium]
MRTLPLPLVFFLLFLLFTLTGMAAEDAALEEIAERFFPLFIEGKDTLQTFEMSDTIRSFVQGATYKDSIKQFHQMFGGIGELKKKETIQHNTNNRSVELFYSGKTNSFQAGVSFSEKQIVGVWFNPWTDEQTYGGTPIQLETPTGTLYGTLLEPENATKPVPVALFLAGSGPTDRNGNQLPTLHTDSYRLLAEALQKGGIASVRFDKRGIGASAAAGKDESKFRFEHFVDDAVLWIERLSQENKYSKIIVLGHSEGSLIGMLACAQSKKADGFISLCGAGRPVDELIREQMKGQPQFVKDSLFPILDELKKGNTVEKVPEALLPLVRPSVQPYMISWMKYDPQAEIKKLTVPVMIVQGTTDIQVSDTEKLAEANPQAKKVIVKNMNHTLKTSATTTAPSQQPYYTDPKYPIHEDLVPCLVEFIGGIK